MHRRKHLRRNNNNNNRSSIAQWKFLKQQHQPKQQSSSSSTNTTSIITATTTIPSSDDSENLTTLPDSRDFVKFQPLPIKSSNKCLPDTINGSSEKTEMIGNLVDNIHAASSRLRKQKAAAAATARAAKNSAHFKSSFERQDQQRPPSPTIIWKESSKVTVATNLPAELYKAALLTNSDNGNGVISPPPNSSSPFIKSPRRKKAIKKTEKVPSKTNYGAWYLPTNQWKVRRKKNEKNTTDSTIMPSDIRSTSSNPYATTKTGKQVSGLFIGQEYRKFLESKGEELPHYLQANDSRNNNTITSSTLVCTNTNKDDTK